MEGRECPPGVHAHHDFQRLVVFSGSVIVLDGHGNPAYALVNDGVWADRIAELVERHGLVDVPDTAENLVPPPPLKSGRRRPACASSRNSPASHATQPNNTGAHHDHHRNQAQASHHHQDAAQTEDSGRR